MTAQEATFALFPLILPPVFLLDDELLIQASLPHAFWDGLVITNGSATLTSKNGY